MGRAAAIALARNGFDVVITARTVREGDGRTVSSSSADGSAPVPIPGSLESTAAEIEAVGGRAFVVPMDLTDRASVTLAMDRALAAWGRIDVVFNNAIYQGPGPMDRVLDLSLDLAETIMRADYIHQLLIVQKVLPQMLERDSGRIINMLSNAAYATPPAPAGEGGWGLGYAAAKAAFHRVTDMCHVEFASRGIVNVSIEPGLVATEGMRARGSLATFAKVGIHPAPPEVAAEVVAWLAAAPIADVAPYGGQMVSTQKLCLELDLLPGWSPTPGTYSTKSSIPPPGSTMLDPRKTPR